MKDFKFVFSTMGAWKSLDLIKRAFTYKEKWLDVLIFNSKLDNRFWENVVASRIWVRFDSLSFSTKTNFYKIIKPILKNQNIRHIFIDEAQFLKKKQIIELLKINLEYNIPITCYWLKSDFKWELFEWSRYLFVYANSFEELEHICNCWNKAIFNARIDENWNIIKKWKKILIWWNESYISMCAKCYLNGK